MITKSISELDADVKSLLAIIQVLSDSEHEILALCKDADKEKVRRAYYLLNYFAIKFIDEKNEIELIHTIPLASLILQLSNYNTCLWAKLDELDKALSSFGHRTILTIMQGRQ